MTSEAIFGLSVLMNFVASGIVAKLYVWPRLRVMSREEALLPLVAPHMFRFVGLSFLVPGVVSPSLSPDFARPAAYGDFAAALLAIIAVLALSTRASWAPAIVWIFNLWGTMDLSRRDRRPHRSGRTRRGVLYTDRRGAPASRDTRVDILASAAATAVAAASTAGAPSPRRNEGLSCSL
jgi:hypothetical protein